MITFLFVIELTPHMETMPFAMLCQIYGTIYLNHFVLLTVLKLLNLIWKHIYFQNDIVSVPSREVFKLFIYLSCSVSYFKLFVKRFVHVYAEALYKYRLLLLLFVAGKIIMQSFHMSTLLMIEISQFFTKHKLWMMLKLSNAPLIWMFYFTSF